MQNYYSFMVRRFLRIYPAYLVCLLTLVACAKTDPGQFFSHLFLMQFANNRLFGGINYPFWSLGVEFWFYALLPLIMKAIGQSKAKLIYFLVFSIMVSLFWEGIGGILRSHEHFDLNYNWSARLFLLTALPTFALGIYKSKECSDGLLIRWGINAGCVIAICDVVARCLPNNMHVLVRLHSYSHFIFQGGFGFFVYGCLSYKLLGATNLKIFKWIRALLQKVGQFSYSLYLWHVPILYFILNHLGSGFGSTFLAIFLAFSVAKISYLLIEHPCLNFAKRHFSGLQTKTI